MTSRPVPDTPSTTGPPTSLEERLASLADDGHLRRFAESRQRLADDPYRPLYHFSAPEHVMNDPNGLCQWDGRYHLFYQFRPGGPDDRVHWGHAVSEDLIRWHDLPPALSPDVERDCYSGQTLVESDRVIAMYHGTMAGNGIATASDPLLLDWTKHPANPVIPGDVHNAHGAAIRPVDKGGEQVRIFDPCIWKEPDGYYSLSGTFKDGARSVDATGVAHLFRSADLADWEYLGPLLEDVYFAEPGEDIAVPNFWPIGNGRHMLLVFSHKRGSRYYLGDYDRDTHRFHPTSHGRMNFGPWTVGSLHAPSATIDDQGRYVAIFNVKEGIDYRGWRDVMTLPRRYWLAADDSLRMAPAGDLTPIRFGRRDVEASEIAANSERILDGIRGTAMELEVEFEPRGAREVGLSVLRSPDGAEQTRISFFRQNHRRFGLGSLQVDVSSSSLRSDVFARTAEVGSLALADDEPLRLRVFLDRSLIEVYANDRQCLTVRAYPDRPDSNGVAVFARGDAANLGHLTAWQMRSIWPELAYREGT